MVDKARIGRKVAFTFDGEPVRGTEFGASFNGDPIDISDSGSAGWQELLEADDGDDNTQNSVELSVSFICRNDFFKRRWFAKNYFGEVIYTYPDGSKITGRFKMSGLKEGDPYNDKSTGDVTLMSSGVVVHTPAA